MLLNQLKEKDIRYCKGVGEKKALLFHKLNISNLYDLLTFYPFRYEDRSKITKVKDIAQGEWQTVQGTVIATDYIRGYRGRRVLKIYIGDETGHFTLVCYNRSYLKDSLKKDTKVFVSSQKFAYKYNEMQTSDFDYEIMDDDGDENNKIHTGRLVPIYHSTENLSNKFIRSLIFRELNAIIDEVEDPLPEHIFHKYKMKEFTLSFYKMHFPAKEDEVEIVRQRLAFDRFFFLELVLATRKKAVVMQKKEQVYEDKGLAGKFQKQLPFQLTGDQKQSLKEIQKDLLSTSIMNRLLMGDVGSGKTIVAVISALLVIENGCQVAFMAPTEILAKQHYINIKKMLDAYGLETVLLIGKQKVSERKKVLAKIVSGEADLIIGTHALLEDNVEFKKLGLIIIDEQHRFGVLQRAKLHLKAKTPDVLVMTATPIPRTLSMTVYGDLDVSIIREMPPGRKPIKTRWYTEKKLDEVYEFLRTEMKKGHQVYVVYPLVKESEKLDLKDAESMYESFRRFIFMNFNVGLIHGKMKKDEKDFVMDQFRNKKLDLLVSTTVIEVGVDVANASVMVVEHAERFGLSQLHQLRGRIGRGDIQSHCALITGYKLSVEGKQRMKAMVKHNDGFKLAEIDLEIRGPGELMGTRQTGLPDLKPADLINDQKILEKAREEAFQLIDDDPSLKKYPTVKQYLNIENYKALNLIQVS
jgi:ATP-dependent DNA helicase RecG